MVLGRTCGKTAVGNLATQSHGVEGLRVASFSNELGKLTSDASSSEEVDEIGGLATTLLFSRGLRIVEGLRAIKGSMAGRDGFFSTWMLRQE